MSIGMPNERARALRKQLTPQDVKLWAKLRVLKAEGFHFRRQAPIESYIVDFVCFKHRLVIDADGGQHGREPFREADARRDAFLSSRGFRVFQFWNSDIDHHLDGVLEQIVVRLINPHPDRQEPAVPPRKGEGEESRAHTT